ncbi:MAG: RagB/SusD family nutrient uptake outer membrane protein, partial [Muribaculaceae bacterium]|nr:RagB/SusD family nutrient uptake outer membrane protein [Muribaculaceae bacterium]
PIVVPYTRNSYLLPIPQDVLDTNPNVVQNPGY